MADTSRPQLDNAELVDGGDTELSTISKLEKIRNQLSSYIIRQEEQQNGPEGVGGVGRDTPKQIETSQSISDQFIVPKSASDEMLVEPVPSSSQQIVEVYVNGNKDQTIVQPMYNDSAKVAQRVPDDTLETQTNSYAGKHQHNSLLRVVCS